MADHLILSQDAEVELDGKKMALKEGCTIQIDKDKSLFQIDSEFEIITEEGKFLIESGDYLKINESGEHKVASSSEFVSNNKSFVLEKGDKFTIVEDSKKIAETINNMFLKLVQIKNLIGEKANKYFEDQGGTAENYGDVKNPYNDLLKSKEFKIIQDIEDLSGRLNMREIVEVLDIDDPEGIVGKIQTELERIGDKHLVQRVKEIAPKSLFGKIWQKLTNSAKEVGGITARTDKLASREEKTKFQAIIKEMQKFAGKGKNLPLIGLVEFIYANKDRISKEDIIATLKWNKNKRNAAAKRKIPQTETPKSQAGDNQILNARTGRSGTNTANVADVATP